jgi:hypothetical protein
MTDYSDLNDNVRNYTETTTSVLSDSIIQPFIKSIEDQIMRTVDLNYYRQYYYATLTVGNPFLPLPSDWQATRYLQIYPTTGATANERTLLLQKDISFMNEYWPDRTAKSTPKYYAMWDQDTHYLAPTPDAAIDVELAYTYEPDGLSSGQTSTWLSQNAPNVLLYGCILQALGYLKGPA